MGLADRLNVETSERLKVEGRKTPPPTPGGFCERVRKRLKTKELSFWRVQKTAQESEKTGDRSETHRKVRMFERLKVEETEPPPHHVFVKVLMRLELEGGGRQKD